MVLQDLLGDFDLSERKNELSARISAAQQRHIERTQSRAIDEGRPSLWALIRNGEIADRIKFVELLKSDEKTIKDQLYEPKFLNSEFAPFRFLVKDRTFLRTSFKETVISDYEFERCDFEGCVFIGTILRNCRFNRCKFTNCNFFRVEFYDCFLDPAQFRECVPIKGNENVGLHLYHELLANSRQQAQPDYADEAQFRFRKWQRYQLKAQLRSWNFSRANITKVVKYLGYLSFDLTTGSGMRLRRLFLSALLTLALIAYINLKFAVDFGLQQGDKVISTYGDAVYVSTIIITNLGFGDITPSTQLGRMAISLEAIFGFVLFATLASALYRRFTS